MALRNYLVGEVTEDFIDGLLSRREAIRRLTLLGLSMSSATALLAACGDGNGGQAGGATSPAEATPSPAAPTTRRRSAPSLRSFAAPSRPTTARPPAGC